MQYKTLFITMLLSIFALPFLSAQIHIDLNKDPVNLNIKKLKAQKERIRVKEKEKLKAEVKAIHQALEKGKITEAEAESKKKDAAEKRAQNIEDQLNIISSNIDLLTRNRNDPYYKNMKYLSVKADTTEHKKKEKTNVNRTYSGLVMAFGLNNAIGPKQSINEAPYKIGGSRFFQIGWQFTTVLTNSGFLRVNYGLMFQFNGLKPTDDRYFVRQGDQVELQNFPYDLNKAKLRFDNLVIPVHFEIGPTDKDYNADEFKLGLGGYAGLNLKTMQKLKFKENGHRYKEKRINSYNTTNFIYGLSAYVGYDWLSLYVKYDLNPIFNDNPVEEHNVAIGLRLSY